MPDPRIDKLADVLVDYSVAVQPGDRVLVQGDALVVAVASTAVIATLKKRTARHGSHD